MPSDGDCRQVLLPALISFVQLVLEGATLSSVRPFDFGANLTAVHKKQVGIWPNAVSCTLCRLTAKVAGSLDMKKMGDLFAPRQLRFGISGRGGCCPCCEALCLTFARLFWSYVHFRNASIRRDKMLMLF